MLSLLRRGLGGRRRAKPCEMSYPAEPGLTGVTRATGAATTCRSCERGDRWLATVGVDLDSQPGEHAVNVTFRYADGRTARHARPRDRQCAGSTRRRSCRSRSATSSSAPKIKRARIARAPRRARSTTRSRRNAIGPSRSPCPSRREGRTQLRSSPRVQRSAARAAFGRRPAGDDGHADSCGQPRPRRAREGPVFQRQRRLHRPRLRPLSRPTCTYRRSTWPSATSSSAASSSASRARRAA